MEFANVVSVVTASWAPVDDELLLADAVPDPVEVHIYGFDGLVLDVFFGKAKNGVIVYFYWCGRLGMTHFGEGNTEWEGLYGR